MKKFIQFFRKIRDVKYKYLKILLVFSSSLTFGQTITPTKTVVQNVSSCGIIDVELKVVGANPIARPLEVVLVIDRSGSMTSGSPDTSMDHAKDAAIDFINNIFSLANNPTGLNKVAIVSYADTATINQVLTLSSGKAGLISIVNGLNANGATNIQDGILKADNELTAHGSFNCNTSRSIILLTDGVANRTGPSGSSCSGGTGGTCIQSAITAATNAKTTTVSGVLYNNQIFSVGLFGGISGTDQTNATYCLNNIQSGGAFFTESAANLTGIYAQILNQISWVAAQIPGTAFNKETVNNNFNIVAGSISVSKGTFVQTGQIIDWNIDFLNSETITLKYRLTPKPNICGDNIVSTSRLDYLNSSCLATFQNVTTPNYCVPCTPILSGLPSPTTINCPTIPNFITPTVTNGCLSTSLTFVDITTPSTTCPLKFSITRTWTAKDNCNNTSTASQTINVQDVTAPVIAPLPAISTINCPDVPSFATATATDTCGGPVTLTFADVTTASSACPLKYSITRTWTAKDNCNNTSTASQTINVQDVTAPVIAPLPAISTINCPDVPSFATATATDTCGGPVTLTFADVTTASSACPLKHSITRTWTAKDNCNNTSTASQTINVQDVTAPVIAPLPAISTINCPDVPSFATATASDTCGGPVTLTFADVTTASSACPLKHSITRTWTAKDNCNNTSTASQTINVQDVTAPVIAPLPAISTINCPDVPSFATATATDTCGGPVTLTFADVTTASSACPLKHSITRTWTAKDNCNNTSTASQTINVQDITAPVIAPLPAISTINCPDIPSFATATATDACGGPVTLTFADVTTTSTACPLKYSITRTWTAKDNCNNTSTASQTINVQDITAPVIAPLPAISTINCPDIPSFATATATDACGGPVTLTFADVTTTSTACPLKHSITRTWTAKDNCNNTSTASQTINVQDITAPVIAPLPAISTINCPDEPSFATATATDTCGGPVTLTFADVTTASSACPLKYSITRTWTAKDNCNNTSTASQTINVQDITAPVIAPLPAISTINCPDIPSFATATTTDTCGGPVTLTFADVTTASTACPLKYSITRTWTAKDNCNNTSTASQTINVQDITAPVIAPLPAISTINCPDEPSFATATATDTCGGPVTLTFADVTTASSACPLKYSITRTWTAKDNCNNTSTASQTINVQDITAPVIAPLPAISTINCPDEPSFATATATDACGGPVTLTFADVTTTSTACPLKYSITRTWTAKDNCNNTSTASQTINVQDVTPPNITTQAASQTVECDGAGNLTQLNAWLASNGGASASDACSGVTWTNNYSGSLSDLCGLTGAATVTFTATDACGNFSSSTGTFTIQDTTDPTISSQAADSTVECDGAGNLTELNAWLASNGGASASDVCSGVTWTNNYSGSLSDLCGLTGAASVTFTATDACGNFSSSTGTFTIQDTTDPVFTSELPQNISVSCDAIPLPQELTGSDSCSSQITITTNDDIVENEGTCIGQFTILRTWTITDSCGNDQTYTQTISVYDNTAPTLVTPLSTEIDAICSEIPPKPNLEFADNCSGIDPNIIYTETTTTVSIYQYIIVREWTVSDNCGNESSFSQTINVSVNEPFDAIPYEICTDKTVNLFSLLDNNLPTNGTWIEVNSVGALSGSIFTPSILALGYYTIRYIVNVENNPCPFIYEIYIHVKDCGIVLAACDIVVFNAVSPNGDGLNEIFTIGGITCYPNNTVEIYNRWGVSVYKANGYNNGSVSFDGQSQNKLTVGDDKLPGDTYFYILKYIDTENNSIEKTGYLYVKY